MSQAQAAPQGSASDSVRSVERAIDILFACADGGRSLDVPELQRATQLPRPTLYRLLGALEAKGMIYSFGEPKRFQLGQRVGLLAQAWKNSPAILELSREALGELWRTVQETVSLMVPVSATHRMCVAELKSPHALSFSRGTGYLEPLHRGASGKALLAFMQRYGLPRNLAEIAGADQVESLSRSLLEVKRRGHSVTYSEISLGTVAVAAPVLGPDGVAVASVCTFAPELHMNGASLERCIQAVTVAARSISLKLAP